MNKQIFITLLLSIFFSNILFAQNVIFSFSNNVVLKEWLIVNDNVMGGVSKSELRINKDGSGVFCGTISTAYNGGFASIRYNFKRQYINAEKYIVLKIKGDGKKYQFRIKSSKEDYYAYVYPFRTTGDWEYIKIPLDKMYPSFRGMRLNIKNFNKDYLEEISFLIGNKKNENFNLLIDTIFLE